MRECVFLVFGNRKSFSKGGKFETIGLRPYYVSNRKNPISNQSEKSRRTKQSSISS